MAVNYKFSTMFFGPVLREDGTEFVGTLTELKALKNIDTISGQPLLFTTGSSTEGDWTYIAVPVDDDPEFPQM